MALTTNLSLGELGEAMAPGSAESFLAETDRERKHTKSRDTVPGRSGKIYSKNFCNRTKVPSLGGVGGGVRGSQEGARHGQGGGAPGGLLASLELPSDSNRAWNFPNFAKTLKGKLLLTFAVFSYHNSYLF